MLVSGGLGGCYNGGTVWTKDNKVDGVREDTTGYDTIKRLGLGVAEAVMLTTHGREAWEAMKKELSLFSDDKSPIRDH